MAAEMKEENKDLNFTCQEEKVANKKKLND